MFPTQSSDRPCNQSRSVSSPTHYSTPIAGNMNTPSTEALNTLVFASLTESENGVYQQHERVPPHCSLNCSPEEARMRRVLKYFFMNPCEKFRAKRTRPYKLFLQLAKIILITGQLVVFGASSSSHVTFTEKNVITFHHLYLLGWTASYESLPYPPSMGPFSLYTYRHFYSMLDFAMDQYNNTIEVAVGSYNWAQTSDQPLLSLCKRSYKIGEIWASNQSYQFDSQIVEECIEMEPVLKFNVTTNSSKFVYNSKDFLSMNNFSVNFDSLITISLKFSIKSVQLKAFHLDEHPDCYQFDITILFDNREHNGQILVSLSAPMAEIKCSGSLFHSSNYYAVLIKALITTLDAVVIVFSLVSAVLCTRSLSKSWRMWKKTDQFFLIYYKLKLTKDRWEFLNLWYVLILINDALIVSGSFYKIKLDYKFVEDYNVCGYLLGLGSLFVWIGVLRYLSFSYKFNILILTMKRALPNVLRFIGCALVIYIAFSLCAWVVLGPHHIKFRSFFSTLECLFSLLNGDDVFNTFAIIPINSSFVFFFSRVYLYIFCSVFIYVIVNLFITLIIEAYEEVKKLRKTQGRPDTPMWLFIRQCPDDSTSPLYRSDDQRTDSDDGFGPTPMTRVHSWIVDRMTRMRQSRSHRDTALIRNDIGEGDYMPHTSPSRYPQAT